MKKLPVLCIVISVICSLAYGGETTAFFRCAISASTIWSAATCRRFRPIERKAATSRRTPDRYFPEHSTENRYKYQDLMDKVVGTWKSLDQASGESQAVLTIKRVENKLGGSFVFRGLTVNGQENSSVELLLTDVVFDGTTLTFKVTFPEPEKTTTEWALKLRSDNEAIFDMTREAGKSVEDAPSFVMKRAKVD